MSKRGIAILVVTAILALILLGAWVSSPSYENREVCGGCGGSGWFFDDLCWWCKGSGYETETVYENWWCFWVALVALGVGALFAFTGQSKGNKREQSKLSSKTAFVVTLIVGIILGGIEVSASSDAFSSAYKGILSFIVGSEVWVSGISAAIIWLVVVIVCSLIVSKIVKAIENSRSKT